jgi:hypothetical protein
MAAQDIILNDSDLPLIVNGDFVVDNSDFQHVRHIVLADYGDLRGFPVVGVGIRRYQNGNFNRGSGDLKARIQLQLELDGYRVDELRLADTKEDTIKIVSERI